MVTAAAGAAAEAARYLAAKEEDRLQADYYKNLMNDPHQHGVVSKIHDFIREQFESSSKRGSREVTTWSQVRDTDSGDILSGYEAMQYVIATNRSLAAFDETDARYSVDATAAMLADFQTLTCITIRNEKTQGHQQMAAAMIRGSQLNLDHFEQLVLSGLRVPSPEEWLWYTATPPTYAEIVRSVDGLRPSTRGHSLDHVVPEMFIYGGDMGKRVALRYSRALWNHTGQLPLPWHQPEQVDIFKGAPRDPRIVQAHRPLSIQSVPFKVHEGVLLHRLSIMAPTSVWQGVANHGVGVEDNLRLVLDIATYRASNDQYTFCIIDDIRRGFPSTSYKEAALALHHQGARGHVLDQLIALYSKVDVCIQLGPRQFAQDTFRQEAGLAQGGRTPPTQFTAVTRGALEAVARANLGIPVAGILVPAVVFMDDFGFMVESVEAIQRTFKVTRQWAYENRKTFDADKCVLVQLGKPVSQPSRLGTQVHLDFTVNPMGTTQQTSPANVSITRTIKADAKLIGFHLTGHIPITLAHGSRLLTDYESRQATSSMLLRVGQERWIWTLYIRPHLEYCSSLYRLNSEDSKSFDRLQLRALLAPIRRGAPERPVVAAVVLRYLFGEDAMATRRLIARVRQTFREDLLCERSHKLAALRASRIPRSLEPPAGRAPLILHWRSYARQGQQDTQARRRTPQAQFWKDSITGDLLRARDYYLSLGSTDSTGHDPDAELIYSSDDNDEPGFHSTSRSTDWPGDSEMRRRVSHARRTINLHARRAARASLRNCTSAAMIARFGPTRAWRRKVLATLPAGPGAALYMALLAGCAWTAPMTRSGLNSYASRYCSGCGACAATLSWDLDLHFFDFFNGQACPAPHVLLTRRRHRDLLRERYDAFGEATCFDAAARLEPRARLAFILGSPSAFPQWLGRHLRRTRAWYGDFRLPLELQMASAEVFIEIWGPYSAQRRSDG